MALQTHHWVYLCALSFLSTILTSFMEAEVFWLKAGAMEIKVAAFKMNMGPVLKMKGETLERGSSDLRLKVTY